MPATTPNRAYPYPVAGDPTNPPGDIEALARAVDADVTALAALAHARPQARVSSQTTVTAALVSPILTWDVVDYNEGGVIEPLVGTAPVIRVTQPGFYFMFANVAYLSGPATASVIGSRIELEGGLIIGQTSTPFTTFTQGTREMDVGATYQLAAGDGIRVAGVIDPTSANPSTWATRSLTILRMTQS